LKVRRKPNEVTIIEEFAAPPGLARELWWIAIRFWDQTLAGRPKRQRQYRHECRLNRALL
jgi:hypothetical protein